MPTVAISHTSAELATWFPDEDLARLRQQARVIVLEGRTPEVVLPQLADVDILMGSWGVPKLTSELLAAAPKLRAVCYAAGSVRPFATPEAWARGVTIATAMDANAIPVAEVTMALITLAAKGWFRCIDRVRQGGPDGWRACAGDGHPGNFATTVGLVGFGAIARLVQQRLRTTELKTLVYDPYVSAEHLRAAGAEPVASLDELARRSRIISMHAPGTPGNLRMLGAAFFAAMPEGGSFINTARGDVVDEPALIAALTTGRIDAYLDITESEPPATDSPLYRLPNCWLTPHRAGSSGQELRRLGRHAINDCLRILAGQPPQREVRPEHLATMA